MAKQHTEISKDGNSKSNNNNNSAIGVTMIAVIVILVTVPLVMGIAYVFLQWRKSWRAKESANVSIDYDVFLT